MLFIKITKQPAFNSTIIVICLEQRATQSPFSEIKMRRTGELRLFFNLLNLSLFSMLPTNSISLNTLLSVIEL